MKLFIISQYKTISLKITCKSFQTVLLLIQTETQAEKTF